MRFYLERNIDVRNNIDFGVRYWSGYKWWWLRFDFVFFNLMIQRNPTFGPPRGILWRTLGWVLATIGIVLLAVLSVSTEDDLIIWLVIVAASPFATVDIFWGDHE